MWDLDDPTRSSELTARLDLLLYDFTRLLELVLIDSYARTFLWSNPEVFYFFYAVFGKNDLQSDLYFIQKVKSMCLQAYILIMWFCVSMWVFSTWFRIWLEMMESQDFGRWWFALPMCFAFKSRTTKRSCSRFSVNAGFTCWLVEEKCFARRPTTMTLD